MKEHNNSIIHNTLRRHRVTAGLSQEQVARILGINQHSTLTHWENGTRLPDLVNAFKLAALHSVLVEALFYDLMDSIRRDIKPRVEEELDKTARL